MITRGLSFSVDASMLAFVTMTSCSRSTSSLARANSVLAELTDDSSPWLQARAHHASKRLRIAAEYVR